MWLVYYCTFRLESTKDIDFILSDLESIIVLDKKSGLKNVGSDEDKFYTGTLTKNGFKIRSNYRMKNSFRPIITGHINTVGNESTIKIDFILNPIVIILMAAFMIGMNNSIISVCCIAVSALLFNLEMLYEKKVITRYLMNSNS